VNAVLDQPRRTLDQNRLLWAVLTDLGRQINWHGNRLAPEEWKCVLTASIKRQKVVPGIDGGFVVIGQSTSRMTKQELSELIELAYAFGAQQGVVFSDEASRP
jgi:hypothetical protein